MSSLLERFCRYVQVETTADENSTSYPSSEGQRDLAELLARELREFGLQATVDEHAIVSALLLGTVQGAPTIALFAHLDTSPEASGKAVKPRVVKGYEGGDIALPHGNPIAAEDLVGFEGKTLITTDGSTLLGADDKAGVAVIMTAVERLLAQPERPRCPVRVVFTCDEEIGHGTDKLALDEIGAVCGYTLDGESAGLIENETFSGDMAIVTVRGRNIHSGLAYGKMCNALRAAGKFLDLLPPELSPERTRDREPFLHPYHMEGAVAEATIRIILRSFHTPDLEGLAEHLRVAGLKVMEAMPEATVEIEIKEQYRNMSDYLAKEPRAVALAEQAYLKVGITPGFRSIRGGTDGSRLSELGLPTPNLSTGMHNFHCEQEFACLEEMETAVSVLLELTALWSQETV